MFANFDKLKRNLFDVGLFFQIDWRNPVYLDKTGLFMHELDDFDLSWNGGVNGFKFATSSMEFEGEVSILKLWFSSKKLGDEKDLDFSSYFKKFNKIYVKSQEIYNPTEINHFGIRNQFIYKGKLKNLQAVLDDNLKTKLIPSEGYALSFPKYYFVLKKDCLQISYNLSCVKRSTNATIGPETGLLVDIDFRWHDFLKEEIMIDDDFFKKYLEIRHDTLEWFFTEIGLINGEIH